MKLYSLSGRLINKNVNKRRVDWNGKSRSILQRMVKDILREIWELDIVYEEFPVFGSRYSLDFYNASKCIALEVQGKQHTQYNQFFHGKNRLNFGEQLKRDGMKRDFCDTNDIRLIEIFEEDRSELSLDFMKKIIKEES